MRTYQEIVVNIARSCAYAYYNGGSFYEGAIAHAQHLVSFIYGDEAANFLEDVRRVFDNAREEAGYDTDKVFKIINEQLARLEVAREMA